MVITLTKSQCNLLTSLGEYDCAQYLAEEGLEIHDVGLTSLLGAVVSITYPASDVQALERAGHIRLVTPDDDPTTDRAYYEVTSSTSGTFSQAA